MLREFSKELAEDRSFEFGGHVFKFQYPHWEEGASLFDEEMAPAENGNFSWKADTEMAIKRIPTFLDPENDAHAEFKKIVARKAPNAVPRHQIVDLYQWLVRTTSGLPTEQPSALEPGAGASEDSSAGESS